jgi:hypothetical protein
MFSFAVLATKNRRGRRGIVFVLLAGFSHKEQERQERKRGDRPRETVANRGFGYCQNFFSKKFVIGCHRAHTFKWLNLLLEPKRHLQRFGFVFLEISTNFDSCSPRMRDLWYNWRHGKWQ